MDAQKAAPRCRSFNYALVDDVTADALRQRADRIGNYDQNKLEDMVRIGADFRAAKAEVPYGQFGAWVRSEIRWAATTARNYMRLARWLGGKTATLAVLNIQPTAALALAARHVPPEARVEALERAHGEKITPDVARQIIDSTLGMLGLPAKPPLPARLRGQLVRVLVKCAEHARSREFDLLTQDLVNRFDGLTLGKHHSNGEMQ